MTLTDTLEHGTRDARAVIHDLDQHHVVVDIPHDRVDTFRTSFAHGAFAESFVRRLPTMVWQHNREKVIGSAKSAEVLPACNRLIGVFSDFNAVPLAREVHANIRDGHIRDFSFYFDNALGRPHPNERGVRQYVKADMIEFSPVVAGSVPGAKATSIRSQEWRLEDHDVERAKRVLQRRFGPRSALSAEVRQRCIDAGGRAEFHRGEMQLEIWRTLGRLDRRGRY